MHDGVVHLIARHAHGARINNTGERDHRDVGSTAADIADKDQLPGADLTLPAVLVRHDPAIKRGLRLFQERHVLEARALARGLSQLARGLVERGRDGQNNLLVFKPERLVTRREREVPGVAHVAEVVG